MLDAMTIEHEAVGGQVILTTDVDNYPGVPHTDGYTLVEAMQHQAEDLGAQITFANVGGIELNDDGTFDVATDSERYNTKTVILAGGATPRKAGFSGEKEFVGRGVSYCATCDGMFFRNREVFVIGGGNSAAEEALFLANFASHVTMVVRKDHLRAQAMVGRQIEANDKVSVRYLTSIVGVDGSTSITSITFRDNTNDTLHTEQFDEGVGVFVFVGRNPASQLVSHLVDTDAAGYVITDDRMATKTPGLFVAGDVRQKPLRQIVTAASDGAIAATSVSAYLGHPVEG
jgi:thioredoxin reductase (NADPH)